MEKITGNEPAFPPAEGAEAQRCPVCMGKGLVPNSFYATTSGIGSTTQTYLPEKCRTCNGAGVILPSYLQKQQQPTAEGAEEINKMIGQTKDSISKRYNKNYWEILEDYHSNGRLTTNDFIDELLQEFATLHAQRIADKMVAENLVEFGNMIRDEPNGDIAALAEYFIRTINLKSR